MKVELRCYSESDVYLNSEWVEAGFIEDLIGLFPEVDFTDKEDCASLWISNTEQSNHFGISYENFKKYDYEIRLPQ